MSKIFNNTDMTIAEALGQQYTVVALARNEQGTIEVHLHDFSDQGYGNDVDSATENLSAYHEQGTYTWFFVEDLDVVLGSDDVLTEEEELALADTSFYRNLESAYCS